jgi:hypothetical protein
MNHHMFWSAFISAIVVSLVRTLSQLKRKPEVPEDPTWRPEWNPNSAVDVAKWLEANLTAEERAELASRGQ